jgi:hypothetical protein
MRSQNNNIILLVVLSTCLLVASCGPSSRPPGLVREGPFSTKCPDGWKATTTRGETAGVAYAIVELEGPNNGLILFSVYGQQVPMSLQNYSDRIAKSRMAKMPRLMNSTDGLSRPCPPLRVHGAEVEAVAQDFVASLLGVDVPHHAVIAKLNGTKGTVFLFAQAPSEHWEELEPYLKNIFENTELE